MIVTFHIYLASKAKWAHLKKSIEMPLVPRVGESVKFLNKTVGDYFPFKVVEVEYRESGQIEVMTDILDNDDNRMYSFENDEEFKEYYESYLVEGWICERGIGINKRYVNGT